MQMGRYVARIIAAEARGAARGSRAAFVYRDKGVLATIGRAKAVALVGGFPMSGMPAWLFWALVHVFYLIGFRNRVAVMLDWAWDYFFFERGARLITGASVTRAAGTRSDRASPP
jgi:NADH dehydrogenase